jgi:large subunit ribosomal protein L23
MATKTAKKNTKEVSKKGSEKASHPFILGPRITEKSALSAERNKIYTFNVAREANKNEIKKAIKMLYGVTPLRVGITQITKKVVLRGGILGTKQGGKKAIVHLKKGDTITFA